MHAVGVWTLVFFFMFAVCFHCIQFICVWTILILSLIKFIFSQRDSVCGTARQLIASLFGSPRRNAYRFNYIKVLPGDGWQLFCYFFFFLNEIKKNTNEIRILCKRCERNKNETRNNRKMQLPAACDAGNTQKCSYQQWPIIWIFKMRFFFLLISHL